MLEQVIDAPKQVGRWPWGSPNGSSGSSAFLAPSFRMPPPNPLPRIAALQVVGEVLRNPRLLDERLCPELPPELLARLQADVARCVYADCCYSPLSDVAKQVTGLEFELYLQRCLEQAGVAFWSEGDLRRLGFHKTPDFRLKVTVHTRMRCVCVWGG